MTFYLLHYLIFDTNSPFSSLQGPSHVSEVIKSKEIKTQLRFNKLFSLLKKKYSSERTLNVVSLHAVFTLMYIKVQCHNV